MGGFIALLLKLLPLLSSLIPIIMSLFNHQTAALSGGVGMNQEYLTYVVGQGAGGGLVGYAVGSWVQTWGLNALKCGAIGYRLRIAAQLSADSSEKEIDKACEKLK